MGGEADKAKCCCTAGFCRIMWSMRISQSVFAVAFVLATTGALAAQGIQAGTNAPVRRSPPAPPLVSPELRAPSEVVFRLRASRATEVKLAGQLGPERPLTKDAPDISAAETDPRKEDDKK